jgi:hypothetical protein
MHKRLRYSVFQLVGDGLRLKQQNKEVEMKTRMHHTDIGDGHLTDEHVSTEVGFPVFVADDGTVYGSSDKFPRYNCNVGYLHKADGEDYTEQDLDWVHEYIVRTNLDGCVRFGKDGGRLVWQFGASWKTAEQLAEIENRNGAKLALNMGSK